MDVGVGGSSFLSAPFEDTQSLIESCGGAGTGTGSFTYNGARPATSTGVRLSADVVSFIRRCVVPAEALSPELVDSKAFDNIVRRAAEAEAGTEAGK
mmetsp:Transcript_522/g.1286  ORF Transcript_522/g.1286 Transcript_522/m.1286 type:complete len:97 (+) Transcript_522:2-292(+)